MTEPHVLQRNALHALHQDLGDGGRAVVVMPCGSGKTLLGRWFAEQLAARITVVFVPSLALVPQTLIAYRSDTSWRHQAMIVCSDQTSGRAVAIDDLELPAWARESVTSSTSTRAIRDFLAGGGPARVIVSTYHSAPRVAAALQAAGLTADLAVCDEAHRLTGLPRREFRSVLEDDGLPAKRRLFLTATPVEAAAWAAENDDEDVTLPLTLDDETLFGPTIYRASFADAIAAGRLVDYDVEVLAVRPDSSVDGTQKAGAHEAVLTAARAGSTRILTFHSRVSHAKQLAGNLTGTRLADGRIVHAEHLEARHRSVRRTNALERLATPRPGQVRVLASARVLTEGVDVPAVDTVVFAEPRTSAVDIVQAVGRAMRRCPGKARGRIVLAVTAGGTGIDEDTELSATAWRHVWIVLRALASMDPRFASRLRTRAMKHSELRNRHDGPGLELTLPDGIDLDRWMLRALDRTGGSWWHHYDLLKQHVAEQGSARPSSSLRRGGVALGQWVGRQRTLYKQGILDQERIDALEQLYGWAWTARDASWWRAAAVWIRLFGSHWRPAPLERWDRILHTPGWRAAEGNEPRHSYRSLAEFVVDTVARRRRGELPGFLEDAAGELPDWSWDSIPADDAQMVDALAEYAAWKKDLNPPHDYRHDDDLPLGAWLTSVRRRRYTGRIHPALALELELLGRWDWQKLRWEKAETSWRLGYLALRQFVAREGKCRVPYEHVEPLPDIDIALNRWCVVQRQQHRQREMAPERVATLEQVPGWQWEVDLREGYRPELPDVEHGRRSSYVKGCRCDPCCDANRVYALDNMREGGALVDAAPSRGHIRMLLAAGATQKGLARAGDVNVKTVIEVADGTLKRVRPETESALLALTKEAADENTGTGQWGELVPAGPTWDLIDWMVLRGWPKSWIGREIGQEGRSLQLKRDRISKVNADKVAELDRRLGRTRRPPPRTWRTGLPTLDELLTAEGEVAS